MTLVWYQRIEYNYYYEIRINKYINYKLLIYKLYNI